MTIAVNRQVQVIATEIGGLPVQHVIIDGPARPRTVQEWAGQQAARLGGAARSPAGQLVVRLLSGDEDAVRGGRDLDEQGRYAVLSTLEACRSRAAATYPAAMETLTRMRAAWIARWGDKPPRPAAWT
jgi:hypothetical protein